MYIANRFAFLSNKKMSGLTFTRVVLLGIGVRLTGGSGPFEGRAEVFHNDKWGSICDDGFTVNDGKIICRMLGFSTRYIFVSH